MRTRGFTFTEALLVVALTAILLVAPGCAGFGLYDHPATFADRVEHLQRIAIPEGSAGERIEAGGVTFESVGGGGVRARTGRDGPVVMGIAKEDSPVRI